MRARETKCVVVLTRADNILMIFSENLLMIPAVLPEKLQGIMTRAEGFHGQAESLPNHGTAPAGKVRSGTKL